MSSDLWRAVAQQRERTRALAEQDAAAWRQAAERLERQRDKTAAVNRELNAQLMEAERRHIRPWLAMLKDADDTANQLVSIALAHHANHQATLDTARRLARADLLDEQILDLIRQMSIAAPLAAQVVQEAQQNMRAPARAPADPLDVDAFLIQVRQAMYAESARRPIDST